MLKENRLVVILLSVLLLITLVNTCNSCGTSRKVDELSKRQDTMKAQLISRIDAVSNITDLRMQMLQPQIVSEFLSLFNSAEYRSEIEINNQKIKNLQLQLDRQHRNDTTKAHRP